MFRLLGKWRHVYAVAFAKRVKEARSEARLTQVQLASDSA